MQALSVFYTRAYFDAFAFVFEEIEVFEDRSEVICIVLAFFPRIAGYGHVRSRHFLGAAGPTRMAFEQLGALAKYHLEKKKPLEYDRRSIYLRHDATAASIQ